MRRAHYMSVAQHVNKVLTDIATRMGGGKVQVGFLEGATYPDGTPVAAVAFWDEFGHGGNFPSPPRPYFRVMIAKNSPKWPEKMAALAKVFNYDGAKVLQLMGEDIAGALKQSIIETNDPPLSATTLVLRARFWTNPGDITISDVLDAQKAAAAGMAGASGTQAKPLVWSGHMLNSVGYEVKK
jgi:hypothetical protein